MAPAKALALMAVDLLYGKAEKDWYKNYFIAPAPKLEVGGCFTAHNASNTGMEGIMR